jgi:AICAR transformylase/IMP cyclohydrolase PurH
MVTYVFKDGVVGVKLTTSSITTESAYHMLGNFGMFGNLYDTVNAYGAVYDIANMRITKGVIEHFNPAGFVQPTGARGVLN